MNSKNDASRTHGDQTDQTEVAPHPLRIPGFIIDDEMGLGDVIKRATSYLGLQPCGGCERRAAALNRWLVLAAGNRR